MHPLLTPFETAAGTRHVWTTFSADQVDLNFAEPAVLVEMLDVLLGYAQEGRPHFADGRDRLPLEAARDELHPPAGDAYRVLKIIRDVLDAIAPGTLILSETNVPHAENISYFGGGGRGALGL